MSRRRNVLRLRAAEVTAMQVDQAATTEAEAAAGVHDGNNILQDAGMLGVGYGLHA